MKRDMNLIRRILEYLEDTETTDLTAPPEIPNVSTDVICYHARLCRQAGYISEYRETLSGDREPKILVCRLGQLTWAGHQALGELRSKEL